LANLTEKRKSGETEREQKWEKKGSSFPKPQARRRNGALTLLYGKHALV
jgi:hypothetical protein